VSIEGGIICPYGIFTEIITQIGLYGNGRG